MMKNYFNLIGDDLLSKILDIVVDLYIEDIDNIIHKLSKVKKSVKGLDIYKIEDNKRYNINFGLINYSITNYLYSKYHLDNVIIVFRQPQHILNQNIPENIPIVLHSKLLQNPLYLDILREINKLYKEIPYYYNHMFLESINEVNIYECDYYFINPNNFTKDIHYISYYCCY
jgi:hypothetical protein